jgi:putative ABC transport system substrate-binding protein
MTPSPERKDVQAATPAIGLQLITLDVSSDRDIESAFTTLVQRGAGALLVGIGSFLATKRESIITLANRYAIPAMYPLREEVVAGGLMSYGPSQSNAYHEAGIYVGRILKGEKPADLPVMQSTKFEFVLNLKTARTLGLDVPMTIQMTADEVIE